MTRLLLAFATFVGLGTGGALLGVAWPSIHDTFQVPLDAMGVLLTASTIGLLLSSFNSGRIVGRIGTGRFLLMGNALQAIWAIIFVLAPEWWVIVLASAIGGFGSGCIDSGLNTYVATHYRPSRMNWLHACFGLGSTLSPLMVTAILGAGYAWRWSYAIFAVIVAGLAVYFAITARRWQITTDAAETDAQPARKVSNLETLKLLAEVRFQLKGRELEHLDSLLHLRCERKLLCLSLQQFQPKCHDVDVLLLP